MAIAYIVILFLASELLHSLAVAQEQGLIQYPAGVAFFCNLNHLVLLVTSVWYCGWIAGFIISVCDLFAILHCTLGWISNVIFSLIVGDGFKQARIETLLLNLSFWGSLAFMITSFFVAPRYAAYEMFAGNWVLIGISSAVLLVFGLIRFLIARFILGARF